MACVIGFSRTLLYTLALSQDSCCIRQRALTGPSSTLAFRARPHVAVLQALEKFTVEKDIAGFIKKEFDKKHGPTWHCIVGRHFGEVYEILNWTTS